MSQFPVEDQTGMLEGVNYLLSGPAGLGQNFQGFSAYEPAFLRATFRQPFTLPANTTLNPSLYVDIPISNAAPYPSGNPSALIEVTFTSAQANAPFEAGDRINVQNVDPGFYNGRYKVFSCSTTAVVLNFDSTEYTWPAYVSGGRLFRDFNNGEISADNNAQVTIFGPTDRAFISCQNDFTFDYRITGNTGASLQVVSTVERWVGSPTNTSSSPGAEDYLFNFDQTLSEQRFDFDAITANGTGNVSSIFTTVIDQPSFGYYWYFNNLSFNNVGALETNGFYNIRGVQPRAGAAGTYTGVTFDTISGNGSGAVGNIILYGSSDVYIYDEVSVIITTGGTGYTRNDYVKITGDQLGGTTPDNDMTLRVFNSTNPEELFVGNVYLGLRSLTAQVVKE